MTRIETALRRMGDEARSGGIHGSPAKDMLATPTGQALGALVEAAEAMRDWYPGDWREHVEHMPEPLVLFLTTVDAFLAATEPQPAGGGRASAPVQMDRLLMEAGTMTTPTPLREALATALHVHVFTNGCDHTLFADRMPPVCERLSDAILAHPSMQAVAEHEAVGDDLLELAWGVIANAGGGDWTRESEEWRQAAARWRDRYHEVLGPSEGERTEAGR